jgi:tRNA pseudouridine38-40 synthase
VRHIRLVVEYDGTNLSGWQRQDNAPTVQQHLEEALAQLLSHEVTVLGASRTDAGVHARGQVASFRTDRPIALHGIRRGLNSLLPETIAVRDAAEVPDDWNPRFSATGKHYRYTILARPDRSPRWRDRAWHHPESLSIPRMIEGSRALIGEHDFSAFRAAGCSAKTTVRRVDSIGITRSEELVWVDIRGNAFLRQMVRIIVGTLSQVGSGKLPVAQVAEILASRDRNRAGITAPPQGLELVEVRYDGTRPPRV